MNSLPLKLLLVFLISVFCENTCFANSSKDAWLDLVGERFSKRPEFQFVENDPALPNVLIYGDSISIGYTERVRAQLKGEANVYRLYRNGSDSSAFIRFMTKMHGAMTDTALDDPWDFQWDVIHFNVGLHDVKYVSDGKLNKKSGVQVASVEQYKENLHGIVTYLEKQFPSTELVFATTTPVPENADGRFAGDAKKYNKAALNVMRSYPSVRINDLYKFTKPNQEDWWVKPGDVHYAETGKNQQGDQVVKVMREAISDTK